MAVAVAITSCREGLEASRQRRERRAVAVAIASCREGRVAKVAAAGRCRVGSVLLRDSRAGTRHARSGWVGRGRGFSAPLRERDEIGGGGGQAGRNHV